MKKVKITKVPSMAYGGRVFNQVAPNALPYQTDEEMMHYNDTLQPVDGSEANLEAELNEEVVMPNYKGMSGKWRVGGKRHSEGGTPLNLPDDSFVFSDTKAMKLNDPELLKQFGKTPKKGGYTPAELAKPYDINKYRKVLDDPMADAIQKSTAEEMIANYNILLGKLALAQEAKKGFPQGIPFISEPYMIMNNLKPEDILPMDSFSNAAPSQQMPIKKYGGAKKVKITALPKAETGFEAHTNDKQIIPPGSHFTFTERSIFDKAIDELKPKSGIQPFAIRQMAKQGITNLLNENQEDDPMLAYRTMEDTMTGIPTSKGTFDPLNKNNFPYKNDYATYDAFTYSVKNGGSLPKAQYGVLKVPQTSEDQAVAEAMLSFLLSAQSAVEQIVPSPDSQSLPTPAPKPKTVKSNTKSAKTSSQPKVEVSGKRPSERSASDDLMAFNQNFWDEYVNLGKQGAIQYDIPQVNFTEEERKRRATQGSRGKNIYGDLDWSEPDLMSDFKRRHAWYLKENPDFDPHNKEDVKDFQTKYCSRAAEFGMKNCYFLEETDPSGKPGTYFDGKFGEHTWSAPGFNKAETPASPKKGKENPQEEIKPNNLQRPPYYNPFEYYPQDVVNLMTAMGSKIPDPQTFYSNLAWQAYSPAFVKEDYSPIMESANIATQGIGAYGSRQSADASYSGIQGKAARQAADHNLQVANLNVGIYNDAEKFNAQTREKNYMYNQMQKQQNFDTEQAYMADRIKAKNEKRANVAALYNQMLTNAVDTYNLNIMNPNFKVLPGTGGRIAFVNPDMLKPNKDALTSARLREYRALIAEGLTHDQAIDIMGRQSSKAAYPQLQQYPYSNPYDYMTGLNYYEQ